jgi:cell division protein YceG involved in septum cleavage
MSKNKKKSRIKTLWAVMYVLMIMGISLIISAFAIVTVNDVFALVSDNDRSVTLVFSEENTSVKEAAVALQDSGIIRYKWAFRLYAGLKGTEGFESGTFETITCLSFFGFSV